MDALAIIFIWPLLILATGTVFISLGDVGAGFLFFPAIIVLLVFVFGLRSRIGGAQQAMDEVEQFDQVRRSVTAFSIALFLPLFVKYLLALAPPDALAPTITGLLFGFCVLIFGIFVRGNRVLAYSNVLGGGFVIVYMYFQVWSLGDGARIIAAAVGLIVAVLISVVKFRDKLT